MHLHFLGWMKMKFQRKSFNISVLLINVKVLNAFYVNKLM